MIDNGYIKISRSSVNSELYLSEPFTKWQAWCDLIMLAYFSDSFIYVRGIKVDTKRGCVYKGSDELARRWKWSRGKVLRFLSYLEMEQQIVQQKSNVITCISIVNYDKYQSDDTTNDTANSTTNQKKEKKEPKKINKNKEEDIITPLYPPKGKQEYEWSIVSENMKGVVEDWLSYKKEKKQTYKKTGFKTFYNLLVRLSAGDPCKARKIVEQSMANNYSGIFELKENNYGTNYRQTANSDCDHPTNQQVIQNTYELINELGARTDTSDTVPF